MVANGSKIQTALYKELEKVTRFVRMEPSTVRYDLAAYIPRDQYIGFKEKREVYCWRKTERFYCREAEEALMEEAVIPEDERTRRAKEGLTPEQLADFEEHHWRYLNNIPRYELGDKTYHDVGHLWNAHKDGCRCLDHATCPFWRKMRRRENKNRKAGLHMPGLHLFEVKSDKDNYSRLVHQLPQMYGLADYAWLVLGEKQPTPEWLPPYIGVLRFIEKGKKFKVERKVQLEFTLPAMYRHVLGPHNTAQSVSPYILKSLWRKWSINSLFWFQTEEVVLDMTLELQHVGQISKWVKDAGIDLKTVQQSLIQFEEEEEDDKPDC